MIFILKSLKYATIKLRKDNIPYSVKVK